MTARKFQTSIFAIIFLFIILGFALYLTPAIAATKFTITVTQGNNGQISPGTSTVDQGNSKTFDIDPDTGYAIASLTVDGSPVAVASSYTFSNVQANHTITAAFAIANFTITVSQGSKGVISPGTTVVSYGGNQTFNITPNTGYAIASLTVDGSPVAVASSYTFSNVQANHTITAAFAIANFTITVSQGSKGVISPGTTVVSYGGNQTFNITPNTGYAIASLTVDGSPVAVASSYTFSNVVAAHSITATFADKFRITVVQSANGVISPESTDVNYGDNQAFSIIPSSGYSIVSLIVDGSQVAVASTYTFSNVTAVHSISATYANSFIITVIQAANGQISPGTSTVNYGSDKVFAVTATTGYHIADIVVDGVSKGALTLYTFNNVQAAHNITASFAINQYNVTVTVGAFGSSNLASQIVNWGTSLNFILTANTGYSISDIKINGTSIDITNSSTCSFSINITGSTNVVVSFEVNTCDITINSGFHGSVSPGNQTVNWGSSLVLTISPEVGYHVANVIVNDTSVGALTSYSFSATGPTSISATFAINTFTITVVQGSNGVINPETTNVNYGDSSSFTITPNSGYSIASLIVDGSAVAAASSYTFSNVIVAHSITATFAINTFTITVVQGSNGVINPETTNVNYGDSSSFTITPNSGYSIASLIVDGSAVAAASSYTFSNVIVAHSISATFSITTTPTPTPTPTSAATSAPTPTATIRPTSTPSPEPSKTPEPIPLHDITISQITPSANKVQVGQPLNFEVTIKNRGTASETFKVILYGNDTIIGEQTIVALASNTEKKLIFQWDTSGFAKESLYSIKAITSEIKNDSDPENNISPLKYVQLAENLAVPIGLGVLGGTTWIYLVLGLAGFSAACLLFIKKRKPKHPGSELRNLSPKSFQGISTFTDGAFPDAYSIMIVGQADSEKSVFCQQLANGYLRQGKPILYVTYDQFPEEVRTNMKELGWDITSYEQKGDFIFLDAYSSTGGKMSEEKYSVKQPFALSELGIAMSMALTEFGRNSAKVFLDSTAPLFTRVDPSKVVEFLQDRIAKVKGENAMFFFIVGKGTIQESFQHRLEEMVDCVIELEMQKEKKKTVRKMRFKKLRGQKQPNFEIAINSTDELTLSILQTPTKNQK